MPRIPPSLIKRAGSISPYLAALLPTCRTIPSAQTELRWMREHVARYFEQRDDKYQEWLDPDGLEPPPQQQSSLTGIPQRWRGKQAKEAEKRLLLNHIIRRRAAGEPLQYVLGTQPFGDLDILCERGVLIPRPETEAWALRLAGEVKGFWSRFTKKKREKESEEEELENENENEVEEKALSASELRILDVCSGTGCIGLLLYEQLAAPWRQRQITDIQTRIRLLGLDINPKAVRLAQRNVEHNEQQELLRPDPCLDAIFHQADVFEDDWLTRMARDGAFPGAGKVPDVLEGGEQGAGEGQRHSRQPTARRALGRGLIDVLVSNPPYISAKGFNKDTQRSVRNHEPRLALVPELRDLAKTQTLQVEEEEDVFYARLLQIASILRPRIAIFEVGDMEQAVRVVRMAMRHQHGGSGVSSSGHIVEGRDGEPLSVEIWRDWPDQRPEAGEDRTVSVLGRDVDIIGSGLGRAVVLRWG
ncbi:S-adenosyl-L-methionine-dependent methyltransferase [Xylariaceae sp. FL0255]|nr:S-adenosyl-L-methionine-dependent methyltransferase [Xylariaceae sp. FL0255]